MHFGNGEQSKVSLVLDMMGGDLCIIDHDANHLHDSLSPEDLLATMHQKDIYEDVLKGYFLALHIRNNEELMEQIPQ